MTTGRHQITYLQRQQLDPSKWDSCIERAGNGLIYAYSFYLDAMATQWDALVLNDYEAVMPLPWRKKGGIRYLYQPFLTAQLGVFGNGLTPDVFSLFLQAVPAKFRYWDFSLNQQNLFSVPGFPLHQRMNFVLSLQPSYEELSRSYRENIRRNCRKSRHYGCTIETGVAVTDILALTRLQATELAPADMNAFTKLFQQLEADGKAKSYGVYAGGKLLASAAFLFSHHRAYYLLVGNHPNGRTLGASHALIDAFIRDHAGSPLLLDFEGSDHRNLAFFYSSFGAKEEPYAAIRLNRLPWWLRWLK